MVKPAVIGKDGRTSAITTLLQQSPRVSGVVCLSTGRRFAIDREEALNEVLENADRDRPDFVIVGPEEPLEAGVVDALRDKLGIPCVGPTASLARIESSKSFTRQLVYRHKIPGNPEYRAFQHQELDAIKPYLRQLGDFVVKPDGLTGGKGVKVSGVHLDSYDAAVGYCAELFQTGHPAVIIEEKLEGEEFSLQSFCDGTSVVDMVLVQDHKRARDGDEGPNTGGMGSYSCEDHCLPFLRPEDARAASEINSSVAQALFRDTGERYKGVLYGGFMATRDGVRLLEYNARLGDPEALNVLSLLRTDFADVCEAVIRGKLGDLSIEFDRQATVCKYIVPEGYPGRPVRGERLDLSHVPKESRNLKMYFAALDERQDGLYLTGSRAIGFVGIGKTLDEAEQVAEEAASAVRGHVYHRKDIGTRWLVEQRVSHMRQLRASAK